MNNYWFELTVILTLSLEMTRIWSQDEVSHAIS